MGLWQHEGLLRALQVVWVGLDLLLGFGLVFIVNFVMFLAHSPFNAPDKNIFSHIN